MNPLKFYIIIIPGTLRYLKFALWSLYQRTDHEIVLVANGLDDSEYEELKSFCNSQILCEYIQTSSSKVLGHGHVLNLLLGQHKETWFCFCDSDIVSLDPSADDIPSLNEFKAVSSCDAMFWDGDPVRGVLGRCNQWPDGSANLSSFYCVYHTQTTKDLIKKYNVGFENIAIKKIHSEAILSTLKNKGVFDKNKNLDTGKILTLALEIEGYTFKHVNIPSLLHIGGMSSWMLNGDKELKHAKYHLSDKDLYQLADTRSWLYNKTADNSPEKTPFYLRRQQRLAAARYCFQLISHYVDNSPKPTLSLTDKNFVKKTDQILSVIKQYYLEFP